MRNTTLLIRRPPSVRRVAQPMKLDLIDLLAGTAGGRHFAKNDQASNV